MGRLLAAATVLVFLGSLAVSVLFLALAASLGGCGGAPPWGPSDTKKMNDAVRLGLRCDSLCVSDAGCSPAVAAGCLEAMTCNVASAVHRHGGPDLVAPDAGCAP